MPVIITDSAVGRFKELVQQGKMTPDACVRVGVKGGGCNGYTYMFDFDAKRKMSDKVFTKDGVQVVVDPKSYRLLDGLTLDFERSLMKQAFVFKNPNATSSCGCGVSFGV